MECYVLDKKSFRVKERAPLIRYRITAASIYDETSDFDLDIKNAQKGDFIWTDIGYSQTILETL